MAQVINTNMASLNAQRNLNSSQGDLQTSLQRLSSGLRINSAKDDAAGLAISERFTAQIRGLNQAVRNANDGISFAQTAESALGEVGNALQRVRELAVQSANDTNSASDRQALNDEVQALISEVNRIANATQFNGQNVLDGSSSELTFQVGANQGQTISVDGVNARGSRLGAETFEGTSMLRSDIAGVSGFTLNGEDVDLSGASDGQGVIDAINEVSADSGVTAHKSATTEVDLTYTVDGTNATTINLNGVNIDVAAGATNDDVLEAINAVSGQTGVTAANSGTAFTLTASDGSSIEFADDATNEIFDGTNTNGTYDAGIVLATDVGESIVSGGTNIADLGIGAAGTLSTTANVLNDANVLTRDNATEALQTLDFAMNMVNGLRAELGAVQSRFESTISNLSSTSENLSAARSRIQDADFAAETASLTRAQILQQAGTSVLSQANQTPQNVLSLLQ